MNQEKLQLKTQVTGNNMNDTDSGADVCFCSEDYLRSKLLRSASEEGLNIPSTPEFSFDGNLSNSPYPVLNRRTGSRIVSPTSAASESSSYQASMPGSGRSEQPSDSFTTHSGRSERSYGPASQPDPESRQKYTEYRGGEPGVQRPRPGDAELSEALLRTGYFLPEYKH